MQDKIAACMHKALPHFKARVKHADSAGYGGLLPRSLRRLQTAWLTPVVLPTWLEGGLLLQLQGRGLLCWEDHSGISRPGFEQSHFSVLLTSSSLSSPR